MAILSDVVSAARTLRRPAWPRPRDVAAGFAFVCVYVAVDQLNGIYAPTSGILSPWDLSGGLALAFLLARGAAFAPLVAVGELCSQWLSPSPGLPPWAVMAAAVSHAVIWGVAAAWLRRRPTSSLDSQQGLLRLVAAAAVASLVMSAADLAPAFAVGALPNARLPQALVEDWTGEVIGVLILAPFAALWRTPWRVSRAALAEGALAGASLLGALVLILPPRNEHVFRYFYMLFIPQIWITARFGGRGAALANLAIQLGLVIFFLDHRGTPGTVFNYQFRFLALVLTTLFLGSAVSDRQRVAAALRERQDQLARLSRLSLAGEMAAALAHELNQPLLAAIAFTRSAQRLIAAEGQAPPDAVDAMNEAVAQAERAADIIRTLRRFIGRDESAAHPISVVSLLRDTAALADPLCARSGVRLTLAAAPAGLPKVVADAVQAQQVLMNLIQNAVEAVAPGPSRTVVISARAAGNIEVEVEVRDNGPGLTPELAVRLFEPFAGVKPGGMGLGLVISRGIVEAHGGRLWLAINEPGCCAFRFTLPAASSRRRKDGPN